MSGDFFNSWPLWGKMTFVLGCAIVVTFAAGLLKLWHTHRTLQKHVEIANRPASPAMVEAQTLQESTEPDIPFGVRALEQGVKVEGVWISRTNTPNSSAPASPHMSAVKGSPLLPPSLDLRSVSAHDLSLMGSKYSSPTNSRPASFMFERAAGSDRLPSNLSTSTLGITIGGDGTRRHSVRGASTASSNNSRSSPDSGSPTEEFPKRDPDRSSGSTSPGSLEASSDESTSGKGKEKYEKRPRNERANLDLLHSHRLSHVAETGQLTPRTRRPVLSTDLTSMSADSIRLPTTGDSIINRRSAPIPVLMPLAIRNIQHDLGESSKADRNTLTTIPDIDAIEAQATVFKLPHDPHSPPSHSPAESGPTNVIPPFPQFDPPAQPLKPLPSLSPTSARHPAPIHSVSEPILPELALTRPESQTWRKVNSGFEVLVPGSKPRASMNLDDVIQDSDTDPKEKRQSRRLQKKRPGSDETPRASKFVEGGMQ